MNAERLLQHYEQIADAPDAIARLRRFILDLAVRGKLVPQDPADEPASELLNRVRAEKYELSPQRHPKPSKSNEVTIADQALHGLPAGWERTSITSVLLSSFYGPRFDATDYRREGIPTIRTTDMTRDGRIELRDPPLVAVPPERLEDFRCRDGDLLVTRTGSIGTMALFTGDLLAIPSAYLIRFRFSAHVSPRYMHLVLQSPGGQAALGLGTTKVAQPNINAKAIAAIDFNLASLAEQHRIVAKVDELMVLCDELESARTEREAKRDRLAAASLARLNTPDPETFRDDARFALDALPALTARPDQIKQMRQTILDLAVRGKLVAQDPTDEPASELLKRIAAEKARLEKRNAAKNLTSAGMLSPESKAFALPESWIWLPATYPALVIPEGDKKVQTKEVLDAGLYPVVDQGKVFIRGYCNDHAKVIHPASPIVLFGDHTRQTKLIDFSFVVGADGVKLLQPFGLSFRYYYMVIDWLPLESRGYGRHFKLLKESWIPLPPLAEQHRIVAKVDELMALCDQLETSLTNADETRKKLLDALLAEALAPVETFALQEAAE